MEVLEIQQAVAAFRPVLQLVQAGLFLSLLLAVSVFDLKLRQIPDRLNLAIALTTFLVFTPGNLPGVLGALPYLLVLLASLTASILGLGLLAIVCTIVTMKRRFLGKTGRIPFPAGPFLAAGAAAAYFMKLGGLILWLADTTAFSEYRCQTSLHTFADILIVATLNTYTHLGLEDAAEEMKRMETLKKARKEMYGDEKEKPMKQNMFKAI